MPCAVLIPHLASDLVTQRPGPGSGPLSREVSRTGICTPFPLLVSAWSLSHRCPREDCRVCINLQIEKIPGHH